MTTMARVWAGVVLLLVALVACAGQEPAGSAAGEESATSAPAAGDLRIGLTEWSIETGGARLLPGEVRVVVTNTGATGHDVVIHGEQGTWRTPVLAPGDRHEMVITTTMGEQLELVCTVAGHDAAGMRTQVEVEEGAA